MIWFDIENYQSIFLLKQSQFVKLFHIYFLLFILENLYHYQFIDGFKMIAHIPNENNISKCAGQIKEKSPKENVQVYFGPLCAPSSVTESEFEEKCKEYFKRYCESLVQHGALMIPWKVTNFSKSLEEIIPSLRSWFEKIISERDSLQGLVLQNFSIWEHLRWQGLRKEMIKGYIQTDNILDELSTVVYNPHESVILLFHKAKSEKLAADIKSSCNYLKLFILLFYNELKNSDMKLIPLIVTDKNINQGDADCHLCINHVLSKKELADFPNWFEKRENYFQTEHKVRIKENVSKRFLAKVTGVLAAARIHRNCVPKFIGDQDDYKQMEHVKLFLTPEQMNIFYSQDKHMIIRGGFGCGKSIIAAAMLEKIAESLKNDEKLFHICYDARSQLLNEKEKKNDKVKSFYNKDGDMLSEIIEKIAKPDRSEKTNLVVDEYDGEDLDESEAEKLNNIFNNLLKESYVVVIAQPIEKERTISNVHQKKNRFDLLEKTMKEHYLTSNMRNSKEIHELVEATKEVLKEKQTVFFHPADKELSDESEERKESKTSDKSEEKQGSQEGLKKEGISKEENSKHKDHQKQEVKPKPKMANHKENKESSGEKSISDELEAERQSVENCSNTKMSQDEAEAMKGSPTVNRKKSEYGLTYEDQQKPEGEAEHESKGQSVKNYGDSIMGLDEAQAIIGSSIGNDAGGNCTISSFVHAEVDNNGFKIETERPLLLELGDKEEFEKILSLVAILKKVLIKSSKHVLLHFDTEINSIPSALRFAFDHYFNDIKKTTNYEEFQSSNKSILVCSYPAFRGLEYSRVTVLIDRDIYFEQHYLVEMLARCTSKLLIVVLQNSSALDYVITKWKTQDLVNQWKTEISLKNNQNKDYQFKYDDKEKVVQGEFKFKYYTRLKEDFKSLRIKTTANTRKHDARKIITQKM